MLALMGKASSGKDTVKDILIKKYGFQSITTFTTRPMRDGEIPDVTYHYISDEEFVKKIDEGFFAEWKKYIVNGEYWYYGTSKESLQAATDDSIVILTPDGVRDIKKANVNCVVIYLYSNINTIRKRLQARNDANDKAEERIRRDFLDFKNAELIADRIIYNNLEMNIENVANDIVFQYRRLLNK